MSETYLITAKTVEEAIAIANREYADEKHEISYEIIDMPKKGFLGIGAKEAKIKVTVTEQISADLSSIVDDIRGLKSITSRGETKPQKNQKNNGGNQKKPEQKKQGEKKPEIKQETKPETKPEQKSTGLSNQVKQKQRTARPHEDGGEISASSVTVTAPIGISDFKSAENSDFGKSESSSAGRLGNDIKKKKKPSAPLKKAEDMPEKAAEIKQEQKQKAAPKTAPKATSEAKPQGKSEKKHRTLDEVEKLREAVTEAEMEYALEFINKLLCNMKISARAEAALPEDGEEYIKTETATVYPKINITGDDTGILIGHHGETLDSIQYLANLSALRRGKQSDGDYIKIVLDIENYRAKREETLRSLARRMAQKAVKYKRNVFLEPMNAYERHIIHSELHDMENVSTHSVGSDRDRKIIITYEGPDKQPYNRRGRRDNRKNDRGDRTEYTADGAENTERTERRPRKPQKMPIEKLPDFLASTEGEPEMLNEIEY